MLVQKQRPVNFVGESGTAKTSIMSNYLKELDVNDWAVLTINHSFSTSSKDVYNMVYDCLEKEARSMRPKFNKSLVVFIDDLSMPKKDKYATQQPIA
jgi:dynein heavy chain